MSRPEPVRLLMVSSYFDTHPGGLEMMAGRLAAELAQRGLAVEWAATDATPPPGGPSAATSLAACNLVERCLGLPLPILSPGAIRRLDRRVRANDVVLIHDTIYLTSICAALSARRWRKPVLVVQHLGDARFSNPIVQACMDVAKRLVTRGLLAAADQVVFVSETVAAHFAAVRLKRPAAISFIGIDTSVFSPADRERKADLRARFGWSAAPVALYVGRFVASKGLATLRQLAIQRPDLQFAFAGWGPIDPDGWGMANVRTFAGLTGAHLADLYRSADLFVLASPSESFSIVIREALACGLPVICAEGPAATDPELASFVSAVRITTQDRPEEAARAIAARIQTALAKDGAQGRFEFVRRRYNWAEVGALYAGLIAGLTGRAAP